MVWEGPGPYNDVSPAFGNNQFGPRVHNTSKNTKTQKPKNMRAQKSKNSRTQNYRNKQTHQWIFFYI